MPLPFKPEIPVERLRAALSYDPETGLFTWKDTGRRGRGSKQERIGKVAGTFNPTTGDIRIGLTADGYKGIYKAHRIAWAYMTGAWPTEQIDHIDVDRTNNRWANLRQARPDQNKANGFSYKTATHKKGAHYQKTTGRWASAIRIMNKTVHLGTFGTEDEAHARYCEEAAKVRGEFARFE